MKRRARIQVATGRKPQKKKEVPRRNEAKRNSWHNFHEAHLLHFRSWPGPGKE